MRNHLLVAYHSFDDPIFKGLMLNYLRRFQLSEDASQDIFTVITFEQQEYALSKEQQDSIKQELRNFRIDWYPLPYHSGGLFLTLKKLFDLCQFFHLAIKLNRIHQFESIWGFTTLSGVMAFLLSRILRRPVVLMNIEPHSDYMVDFGVWNKLGFKYQMLKMLENTMIKYAENVAVPTSWGYNQWKNKTRGNLHFVPTAIDTDDFIHDAEGRDVVRGKLGVRPETCVILYLGKFGGIYYSIKEAVKIFKSINDLVLDTFFYIVTPDDSSEIVREMEKENLEGRYLVKKKFHTPVFPNTYLQPILVSF